MAAHVHVAPGVIAVIAAHAVVDVAVPGLAMVAPIGDARRRSGRGRAPAVLPMAVAFDDHWLGDGRAGGADQGGGRETGAQDLVHRRVSSVSPIAQTSPAAPRFSGNCR